MTSLSLLLLPGVLSNVVMVRKQDDYHNTNELIIKDTFPLPKIDSCPDALNGSEYFSSYDLCWGYWQTEIDERDRDNTAFVTRKGHWHFKVLSFGLCNAPSQFVQIMELVKSEIQAASVQLFCGGHGHYSTEKSNLRYVCYTARPSAPPLQETMCRNR